MKTIHQLMIATAWMLLVNPTALAVQGLTISVEGTNLVLSWPSTGTENYLIQYRSAFDTNAFWINLTNNYPAAVGTNRTRFLICGVVPPPSQGEGGEGGGTNSPPPVPNGVSAAEPYQPTGAEHPLTEKTVLLLTKMRIQPPYLWDVEQRAPYPWEAEVRPPYPWEGPLWNAARLRSLALGTIEAISLESGDSLTEPGMGFYRVFHVPAWPYGVTNPPVAGLIFIVMDYADYVDRIVSSTLLVNGQPTEFAARNAHTSGGVVYDGLDVYFDRMTNGPTQLQLLTRIRLEDVLNEFTPTLTLTSSTFGVMVSNSVIFTNWQDLIIGDSATFEAFSMTPSVNWTIDVYDVEGWFVISQSGYSADGRISWTWDLYDADGMLRDDWEYDPFFDSYITISPLAGPPAPRKRQPKNTLDFPRVATWLIAYLDRIKGPGRSDYLEAMQNLTGGPGFFGINYRGSPLMLKYGRETTQTERNTSWDYFLAFMTGDTVRNFSYQGHGGPNAIGGDYDRLDANGNILGADFAPGTKAFLTAEMVRNQITFNKETGPREIRFAWLDGCETAAGEWPGAFGVPKATNSLAWYANPSRKPFTRPSVFVGWAKKIGGSPEWGTTKTYGLFRSEWMFQWAFDVDGYELDSAFEQARFFSDWITPDLMEQALRIYGYNKMSFLDYDFRSDWPP